MWFFRRGADVSGGLGRKGERLALRLLKRRGLKLLARNYRCPAGEIDLIVLDKTADSTCGAETVVFVEVKTRSSDRYTAPEGAVDADKRRRMQKVADYYLNTRRTADLNVRFDIVAVVIRENEKPEIRHIPDAF